MKAFITRDSTICSSDESLLPPSFIAAHHEDPFQTRGSSIVYPDARRNILMDINNAENTVLPLPSDKDTLKVFLRVKPRTEEETKLSKEGGYIEDEIVNLESEHQIALTAPKESKAYKNSINGVGKMTHRYTFTQIFDSTIGQKEIFSLVVLPRLQDCLEGQNQLLFTYGATSSGKTYTIQGTPEEPGLMPMALDTLFSSIEGKVKSDIPLRPIGYNRVIGASDKDFERTNKLKETVFKLGLDLIKRKRSPVSSINSSQLSQASGTSAVSGMSMDSLDGSELYNLFPALNNRNRNSTKLSVKDEAIAYTVWISFAEIYNEGVFDLLERIPEAKKKGEKVRRHVLKLSEDKDGSTFIKDITEIQVSSADEAYQAMMIGRENLQFAATKLNHQSSRSHCIFTIKIIRVADTKNPQFARVSMLSFCDLAGSERVSKTQTVGTRQKEAGNINTSLLVLGRCIKAIRSNQASSDIKKHQMIPFRESKLTRLIKNYFTGLGKASLVVCVSQAPYLFDESIHVMKFASIATRVTVEQFKAPAPQPAARRTTRFSSILARGGKQSFGQSLLSGRGSIAWEPSSRSTMIPDFTNGLVPPSFAPSSRSTICPQSNITEMDEEDESDVQDETICESAQYHALLDLVEDLKLKLIDERKKNKTLERNIREQLCDEFNEMLVEIEEMHTGRLERERENMKERSEWRIQQLQLAYKNKGNKRKREGDSGEEFDGNEMKIASLENQVSEKCKEIENLNNQLQEAGSVEQALKDTLRASNEVKDKLQEQNSSLQFQLAEQQRLAAETGRDLLATKNRLHEDQKLNMEKLESEESQISELKIQVTNLMNSVAAKEDECQDMKELLQEAGDEFLEKQEEVKKLENAVTELENQVTQQGLLVEDLETQLEESHVLLREINNQLDDKDTKMEELEEQVFEQKEKLEANEEVRKGLKEELTLIKEKYNTAQKFLDDVQCELKSTQDCLEKMKTESEGGKMVILQEEKQQLLVSRTKLIEELAELKSEKLSSSQEMEVNIYLDEIKNDLKKSEKSNLELAKTISDLKDENIRLKDELETCQLQLDEARSARSVDDSSLEDDELFKLRNVVESLTEENNLLKSEQEDLIKEQDEFKVERDGLLKEQEQLRKDLEMNRARLRTENSEKSILETEDFELTEKLIVKEQETEELKKSLKSARDEKTVLESELCNERKEKDRILKEIQEKEKELKEELEKKRKERMEEMEKELKEMEEMAKKLEDMEEKIQFDTVEKEKTQKEVDSLMSQVEEKNTLLENLKTELQNMKESSEKSLELESVRSKLKSELAEIRAELDNLKAEKEKIQSEKDGLEKEILVVKTNLEKEKKEREEEKRELEDRIGAMTDKLNEHTESQSTTSIIELEGRTGSLEKELATKDSYIRELEDIIMEKELKISELEKLEVKKEPKESSGKEEISNLLKKIKKLEEESQRAETALNDELEAQRVSNKTLRAELKTLEKSAGESKNDEKMRERLAELESALAESTAEGDWREKMRKEREGLEERVKEFQTTVQLLQEKEEEIRKLEEEARTAKDEKSREEKRTDELNKKMETLTRQLKDGQDEIKILKRATKHSAVETQELAEEKKKSSQLQVKLISLEKEIQILQSLEKSRKREDGALELLREEINHKGEEIKLLQETVEFLKQAEDAKEYDINRLKEEKTSLMAHYETKMKTFQQEMASIKSKSGDAVLLGEAMAKATPTKNSAEFKELKNRLHKIEEENQELKSEVSQLQKLQDESKASHERELKRLKKASELTIQEYRETNKHLQDQTVNSCRSSGVLTGTDASTLEADDSKSDNSLIEITPCIKRSGRGRGRGNRSTRTSSLASFEDSNTENEPESSRSKVGRKPRVRQARKNVSFQEVYETDRSGSKKRALKEKQLSPVNELKPPGTSDTLTPMDRKRRRLYSATPQVSEVFTPPTDSESVDSPHSTVKRQLRARRSKKI